MWGEPDRESGVSASMSVGCAGLFAGKPRSHSGFVSITNPRFNTDPV